MQKLWIVKYADAAVEALLNAAKSVSWQPTCPQKIRVVLESELASRTPDRWVVCWTDGWEAKMLWRSLQRLGASNFWMPAEDESVVGLWAIVNPAADWCALRSEIRTKATCCLCRLQNAAPTAAIPKFYCSDCNEFAFCKSGRTCVCDVDPKVEEWCRSYWTLPPGGRLVFLVRGADPGTSSGTSWRNFLNLFLDWCSFEGVAGGWIQFAPIDGDGVIFSLASREQGELFLNDGKHTLHARSIRRMIQINPATGQKLLLDTPHQEAFQIQLKIFNLVQSE
jgi:hypothetical protein